MGLSFFGKPSVNFQFTICRHAVSTVLPGLTHSRRVRIRDTRRDFSELVRAEEVIHTLGANGNTTTIGYGYDGGWG